MLKITIFYCGEGPEPQNDVSTKNNFLEADYPFFLVPSEKISTISQNPLRHDTISLFDVFLLRKTNFERPGERQETPRMVGTGRTCDRQPQNGVVRGRGWGSLNAI